MLPVRVPALWRHELPESAHTPKEVLVGDVQRRGWNLAEVARIEGAARRSLRQIGDSLAAVIRDELAASGRYFPASKILLHTSAAMRAVKKAGKP